MTQQTTSVIPSEPSLHRPELLTEAQVSDYLSVALATIRKWRQLKKGPPAIKLGAAVRYRRADVDAWLDSRPEIGGTPEGV